MLSEIPIRSPRSSRRLRPRGVGLLCTLFVTVTFAVAANEPSSRPTDPAVQTAAASPAEDPEYTKKITARTDKLVADLKLGDAAKEAAVHAIVIAQYRALNAWHDANDAHAKTLSRAASAKDEAGAKAKEELAALKETLRPIHDQFLTRLAAELPAEKVEEVKDLLTYHKVRVTYHAYLQQQPNLNAEDKAKILAWLKEAREEAIDGGSADEKSDVFNKYKGRINNYLSKRGFTAPKGGKPAEPKT